MRMLTVFLCAAVLAACATADMQSQLERGRDGIPLSYQMEADSLEEIRALRPQAQLPMSVAVIPTDSWSYFAPREREVLDEWGKRLHELGFARKVEIVPRALMPRCGYKSESDCFFKESRKAGARMGADAIMFLGSSTATDRYVNLTSILNLTIVGMWLAPAHHRASYSIYEAALFDINNGYLYAVAEGRGEHKVVRPYMYIERNTGRSEAQVKALNDLGGKLFQRAKEQMEQIGASD